MQTISEIITKKLVPKVCTPWEYKGFDIRKDWEVYHGISPEHRVSSESIEEVKKKIDRYLKNRF